MTKWNVIPLEEPPKPASTQWSLGLAMFAAFVIPFVLLMVSGRYQGFIAQARARISAIDSWSRDQLRFNRPVTIIMPPAPSATAQTNVPTPEPATNHD